MSRLQLWYYWYWFFNFLETQQEKWLKPIKNEADQKQIESLINAFPDGKLKTHTVKRLRGKNYEGNVEGISKEFIYEDLVFNENLLEKPLGGLFS